MIVGAPAQYIIDKFHDRYYKHGEPISRFLLELGVEYEAFNTLDRTSIIEEGVYLVTVPSLNIQGGQHQIVIVTDDTLYRVFDPQMGNPGALYYTANAKAKDQLEGAVQLRSYSVDARVKEKHSVH